jgi:hypothetical protein
LIKSKNTKILMKRIKLFFIVPMFLLGMFSNSCKKSDTTTPPTPVVPPGVGEYVGTIAVYSNADTLLPYFLNNNYNRITGNLELYTSDNIDFNKYLVNLKSVTGSVKLYKIRNTDLSFLSNVTKITSDLQISACPGLTSLSGLLKLDTLTNNLIVENNPKITTLDGIGSISTLSSLIVTGNASLQSLSGLSSVTSMTNSISIGENPLLSSLAGLSNLETSLIGLMAI